MEFIFSFINHTHTDINIMKKEKSSLFININVYDAARNGTI